MVHTYFAKLEKSTIFCLLKVDLSKAEQFGPEFLKMNPKHEVPVFDQNGKFITESREIAKYFHENFNMAQDENDHWYPSDPEERKKVNKFVSQLIAQSLNNDCKEFAIH